MVCVFCRILYWLASALLAFTNQFCGCLLSLFLPQNPVAVTSESCCPFEDFSVALLKDVPEAGSSTAAAAVVQWGVPRHEGFDCTEIKKVSPPTLDASILSAGSTMEIQCKYTMQFNKDRGSEACNGKAASSANKNRAPPATENQFNRKSTSRHCGCNKRKIDKEINFQHGGLLIELSNFTFMHHRCCCRIVKAAAANAGSCGSTWQVVQCRNAGSCGSAWQVVQCRRTIRTCKLGYEEDNIKCCKLMLMQT